MKEKLRDVCYWLCCRGPGEKDWMQPLGLLSLRVLAASMMLTHGVPKLLGFSTMAAHFPDPLGVGSTFSLTLAIVGEFVCPLLVLVGWGTRWAAIPWLITMLVAGVIFHAADPFSKKELALLYAVPAWTLLWTGPGAWSLDAWLAKRCAKS